MMLYDEYQEQCRNIINKYVATEDQVSAVIIGIQLEQLKVDYYTALLEDPVHAITRVKDYYANQLENALWLLAGARDQYFDLTGVEFSAEKCLI